mmetsp:Transcript_19148/g.47463  ORF Transcript_19148/g.47463 Transcript_19148/m.47463 type:complete len:242 (-) Transcript_19148:15-740(-)
MFAQLLGHLRSLQCQFAGGHQKHRLDHVLGHVDLLQYRDGKRCGLSGTVLGACQDVAPGQRDGNGLLLNGGGALETLFEDAHEELALKEVVLKFLPLCRRDVLCSVAIVAGGKGELCLPVARLLPLLLRGRHLLLEHAALLLHVLLLGHAHRLLLLPLLPRLPLLLPLMLQVLLLHVLAGGRGYQILHFVLSVVGLSGASRARDLMSRALAARKARRTPERLYRVSRENKTRCLAKALRVR